MNIPQRHISNGQKAFSSYWQPTKTNLLPKLLSQNVSIKDADQRVSWYFKGDDLGDEVAKEYFGSLPFGKAIGKLHQDFAQYPHNKLQLSEATQKLFEQLSTIPSWVNFDTINQGANYCQRCGTSALSVLRNYCLMGGYESSAINKPLIFTQALHKGAVKRLSDTIDFWMYVTTTDGLQPKQAGVFSAMTTRIIHSYSRLEIQKKPDWKNDLWGKPINLWDMIATNLGFSIAFMDGLSKLELAPTNEELESVLHLWKYVGYLIGIPPELLPDTGEQAAKELYLWSKTQKGIDQDSKDLAWALYDEPQRVKFTNNSFMKWFVQKTNIGYNEVLLGNESRSALGLPYSKAKYWILFLNQINKWADTKAKKSTKFYQRMVTKGRKDQNNVWKLYQSEK